MNECSITSGQIIGMALIKHVLSTLLYLFMPHIALSFVSPSYQYFSPAHLFAKGRVATGCFT